MLNPSYLIKSRHDIFYFRYPLPSKVSSRISISLKTRCPKEALRLANALAYHSSVLMEEMDLELMDHADVMSMMKNYYAGLLERRKAKIDAEGPMDRKKAQSLANMLGELDIIEKHQPDLWIYGHTHECDDQTIGKTRIVSNQLGYPNRRGGFECAGFDERGKEIEIKK